MTSTEHTWARWRSHATPIECGGLTVAGYDRGDPDGAPLTFLHGYPSSSLDIAEVADRLGDGWRLAAVDFPGFGASAKPVGHPYTIHAAADSIEALWRALGITSTVLVAHDYGVSVGQELLARRAEGSLAVELTAMVWMNGGLYPDLHRPSLGQQLMLDPEHGAEVAAAVTEPLFLDGIRGTWGTRRPMDDAEIHEIWCSMDDGGGVPQMHSLLHYIADRRAHEDRWREALETSDLPTVFVWGDLDPVSGAHMIARVEARITTARIVRLADVGHWPLLEAPDVVAAEIEQLTSAS